MHVSMRNGRRMTRCIEHESHFVAHADTRRVGRTSMQSHSHACIRRINLRNVKNMLAVYY